MTRTLALILATSLSIAAAPALAKGPKDCPPGLAKKSPACVPPGLAKKGVTADDWQDRQDEDYGDADRLRDGDIVRIDGQEYEVVQTDYGPILRRGDDIFRLPRDGDSDYVRIGDAIVRVDPKTKAVIDLIRITDLILG